MSTVLDRIVAATRRRVEEARRAVPLAEWERRARRCAPARSLARALGHDGLAVIAEIKKTSPSQGRIRDDFDVTDLARQYDAAGADAVSVLTEPTYFCGALEDLGRARRGTSVPLLRKDFVVDTYQIAEARAAGADAVLLIAAVLDAARMKDLLEAAHEFDLDCLVEVHMENELDRLDFNLVRILGVNNRDLRTFEVDIDHSLRIFREVPPGVIKVSESGLRTPEDLARLQSNGVDAALIGGSLMAAPHPGKALELLTRSLARYDAMPHAAHS